VRASEAFRGPLSHQGPDSRAECLVVVGSEHYVNPTAATRSRSTTWRPRVGGPFGGALLRVGGLGDAHLFGDVGGGQRVRREDPGGGAALSAAREAGGGPVPAVPVRRVSRLFVTQRSSRPFPLARAGLRT
jgi:hypothetical protein